MSEEEINKIVKEHYGFSVEEIDNIVGDLSLKNTKLRKKNKILKQKTVQILAQFFCFTALFHAFRLWLRNAFSHQAYPSSVG